MPIDITDQPRRAQYNISGTGPYDFDFEVLAQTDVAVYRDATLLALTTDYTVSLNSDGTGAITLVAATGTTLTVLGARPYRRITDYSTGGDFTADTMNDELDSLQIQILQIREEQERTFALSNVSSYTGSLTFPAPGAGEYIRWNALGDALETVEQVADTGSYTQSGTGAVERAVTAKLAEMVSVLDFIPVALHAGIASEAGTTALQTYIQAALDAHRQVYFPRGRYYITAGVYAVRSDSIHINFEPGAYLDFVGTSGVGLWVGGVATTYDPTVYTSGKALLANRTEEDFSIGIASADITAMGLVAGDIIRITSSDVFYTGGTRTGELARVLSISGTTVTLTKPLDGPYTAANTVVIKENCPVVRMSNVRVKRDTDTSGAYGFAVVWAQQVVLDNCGSHGSRYVNGAIRFCYEFQVLGQWSWDSWYSGTGVSYGLEIATCYRGIVLGANLSGGRHALSIGGYEPCRHIAIVGCRMSSRTSETVGAIDSHANSEFITVMGCDIDGGANMAGHNLKYLGNHTRGGINGRPSSIFSIWRNSDYLIIDKANTFKSTATSSGEAAVWIAAYIDNRTSTLIQVGGQITAEVNFGQGALMIAPFGLGAGAGWTIASLDVDVDVVALTGSAAASRAVLVYDSARGDGYFPVIQRGVFKGRYFATGGSERAMEILNQNTVTKNGDLLFTDLTAEAPNYQIYVDGAQQVIVERSVTLRGGGSVYAANVSAIAEIAPKLYNATANKGIEITSTVVESDTRGSYHNNCTGSISDAATTQRALLKREHSLGAKVGATAGWVVGAANNLGLIATLPASQTGSTLVIPVTGLKVGDTIRSFHLVGQVESGGNNVTIDVDLRKLTAAAADVTDASVATMTQLVVAADTILSSANTNKASLTEVVGTDETFYLLITATTTAATDIALQGAQVVTQEA